MAWSSNGSEKFCIQPFDGKNFDHWKFRMEIILDSHDVKKCIEEEAADQSTEEFLKLDRKCKSIIVQCVANSHLEYIKDKTTAFQMWEALKAVFQRKGVAGQLYLRKKLLTMKLESGNSLESHFIKFEEVVRELKSVGAKLDETDIVCHLLLTLPKSLDPIVTALETLDSNKLTLEFVKGRLLDHEMKCKSSTAEAFGNSATFYAGDNPQDTHSNNDRRNTSWNGPISRQKVFHSIKCNKCGKMGHTRKYCRVKDLSRRHANQAGSSFDPDDDQSPIAFLTNACTDEQKEANSCGGNCISWIVDSGATDHMINDEKYFDSVSTLKNVVSIVVAKSNVKLNATKIGNINITFKSGQSGQIKNVYFCPDLRHNLLSTAKLEKAGLKIVFENGSVSISKDYKVLAIGKRVGSLYTINFNLESKNANVCCSTNDISLWHSRLGHLSNNSILKLSSMVDGLHLSKEMSENCKICSVCAQTKITRLPYNKVAIKVTKSPLELVHSDICGPITPATYDEKKYILTFLDDYTHFCIVFLLKNKSDFFECFKRYEALVTNQLNKKIKVIRCDNGREYCSNDFRKLCDAKGIRVSYTVPYNPEQNGCAERLNRTLIEKGRAMLLQSGLPKSLWGESILCATYLLNRSPTNALKTNVTPAELFYGRKPNLKNIKIFGCLAYSHIPKQKQGNKFDPKGELNFMIGYTDHGYRLWDPKNEKLVIARNIVFDETKTAQDFKNEHVTAVYVPNTIQNGYEENDIQQRQNQETDSMIDENDEDISENHFEGENRRSMRVRKTPKYLSDYLRDDDLEHMALNISLITKEVPTSLEDAKSRPDYNLWNEAVLEEISALNKNRTWTLVDKPQNVKIINCKWVFRIKKDSTGNVFKYKARLVAKGFMQKEGFDYSETYAPVARLTTVRTLLAVANYKNLIVQQMDVKSAFLHGEIEEDVYMSIPEGFENTDKVCKLNKALYGLKQSPYCWNKKFDGFIQGQSFVRSQTDPCLYIKHIKEGKMYLLLYVDDFLIVGNDDQEITNLKEKLKSNFEMQDLGDIKTFLGINTRFSKKGLYLSQKNYIAQILSRFNMSECKGVKTPMEAGCVIFEETDTEETDENLPVRELVGSLMYLMLATRPDLSYSVNTCSRHQSKPTKQLWTKLKRILRYLKSTINLELFYPKNEKVMLVGYADADWAGDLHDRKSTTGYCFKVFGAVVCWCTKKQATVSLSSTEAEYVALAEASKEGVWLSNLLFDLGFEKHIFDIFEDNQSCIKLTSKFDHKRLKHIDVKYNYIKDLIANKTVSVKYLPTTEQVADVLTKSLTSVLFDKFRTDLNLIVDIDNM